MNIQSAISYNSKVQIMKEISDYVKSYFPTNKTSEEFARITARFQKAVGLTVDGCFGPNTQKHLIVEVYKDKPENYIIVDCVRYPVDFKVITYEQDPKWSAYKAGNFRWRDCDVNLFILHWDVTPSSEITHKGLTKPDRDASVHFYGHEGGTIYQALDAGTTRAWHAGSNGKANARSVGIEINNPYYEKYNSKTNPRPLIVDKPVNKNLIAKYLDFHEVQKIAVLQLAEALVSIPTLGIPKQLPRNTNASSHWVGDDKDESGAILRGELSPDCIATYAGIAAHFSFEEMKIDPGYALLEYFSDHGF